MKKVLYIFIIVCILFIGFKIGEPNKENASSNIKDKIDRFEDEITNPNNKYKPDVKDGVNPNITNDIAKSGEKIISGAFEVAFNLLENIISGR